MKFFRKTLSGTIGKNLLNMEFPLARNADGTQSWLLKLRDAAWPMTCCWKILTKKSLKTMPTGNYYIILIHAAYEHPKKAEDGMEMFDASDDTYEYLMCSICPVKLDKAGLCYNAGKKQHRRSFPRLVVQAPDAGFLFPLSATGIPTCTVCSITQRIPRIFSLLLWKRYSAVRHRSLPKARKRPSRSW